MDPENNKNAPIDSTHTKYNRSLLSVIILLLVVIIWLLVKPPIPLLPGNPHNGGPHGNKGTDRERTSIGTVTAYKYNPHLDVNAVQINTQNSGVVTIDFRPHTAETIMKIGPIGQRVRITYSLHPNDEVIGYQLVVIKNELTGVSQVLKDLPPPPDIPNHNIHNFKLDSPLLVADVYGGIVALRKGTQLFHFKPGLVDDIAPLIKSGHHFELTAVRRNENLGFVNINHDKVYIVLSITMDNKTFLVR